MHGQVKKDDINEETCGIGWLQCTIVLSVAAK